MMFICDYRGRPTDVLEQKMVHILSVPFEREWRLKELCAQISDPKHKIREKFECSDKDFEKICDEALQRMKRKCTFVKIVKGDTIDENIYYAVAAKELEE